ncbi:MAG: hypothetical protein KDH88_11100 [Chromatiales bacterium]|nr:hypothetical protein [Chromatiales bacterium]
MPKQYTLYCSRTGERREFLSPGDATQSWQNANAQDLPALIVTNEDGSARIAGRTTTTSGPDGVPAYGKSPPIPTL